MAATGAEAAGSVGPGERHLVVRQTMDRGLLRAFLERDRLYAAYALCNLEGPTFARARWGVASQDGATVAAAMENLGPAPQSTFLMGEPAGVHALLRDLVRPRSTYLATLAGDLPLALGFYRLDPGPPMVRMWVDRSSFRPYPGAVQRLTPPEIGDLNRLYNLGFTAWLPGQAIAEGVYYGLRVNGRLVAAAGTHAVSRIARLGIVGNVMTAEAYRGRGFAKATTSAVTAELLEICDQVVLNVRADNPPALAAYRALGYREHVRFEERLAHRRGSALDGIIEPLRRLIGESRKES